MKNNIIIILEIVQQKKNQKLRINQKIILKMIKVETLLKKLLKKIKIKNKIQKLKYISMNKNNVNRLWLLRRKLINFIQQKIIYKLLLITIKHFNIYIMKKKKIKKI